MQTEDLEQSTANGADTPEQMSQDGTGTESGPLEDTPGAVLKAERLRRNLSEKDVSDKLHITMHYVRAIESNRFDKLPGAVFAKGYIKSYALYLELDVEAVTSLFDGINSQQEEQKVEANRRLMAQRRSDRNKPWVYASVASFVIGFTGLWAYSQFAGNDAVEATVAAPRSTSQPAASRAGGSANQPPASNSAGVRNQATTNVNQPSSPTSSQSVVPPPTAESLQSTAIDASNEPAANAEQPASVTENVAEPNLLTALTTLTSEKPPAVPAAKPASGNVISVGAEGEDVLRIHFTGESWVEVNDNSEQQIYRDIREAGDVLEIQGQAPFSILLGDAPFAKMYLNGTEIDVSDDIRIDNSARLTVGL